LDEAPAQERAEPDASAEVTSLVDDGASDVEDELAADAVTEREEFASPEEAVLSVRDRVPAPPTTTTSTGSSKIGPTRVSARSGGGARPSG
jgi:hypothetical protein